MKYHTLKNSIKCFVGNMMALLGNMLATFPLGQISPVNFSNISLILASFPLTTKFIVALMNFNFIIYIMMLAFL